jgi:hypothetical protein
MYSAQPKATGNSKTKKNESIIIGGPDNDPFGGLGKLLNGFCDPQKVDDDDDSTIASTHSARYAPGDKSREAVLQVVEGPGLSYGVSNGDSPSVLEVIADPELEPPILDKAVKEEEEKEVVKERSLPVLKASNAGPKLRRKRGLEVAIVGIVFVMGTLFALYRLGYEFDLKVVKTQWKSGIDIVFKEKDGTGVPEKMKKWIDIAFKKEPVEAEKVDDVELKKAQVEEKNEGEGHESLKSQDVETKTKVVPDTGDTLDTELKKAQVEENNEGEGHESLKSQDVETKTEVVSDTGDTLDSDQAGAEAQARVEEELEKRQTTMADDEVDDDEVDDDEDDDDEDDDDDDDDEYSTKNRILGQEL